VLLFVARKVYTSTRGDMIVCCQPALLTYIKGHLYFIISPARVKPN